MLFRSDRAGCPSHTFAELQDPTRRSKLEVIRHHLRADQWDVNVDYMCAIPKQGVSCYNENDSVIKSVEYSGVKECFDPTVAGTSYINGVKPVQWCAHYISICTRY